MIYPKTQRILSTYVGDINPNIFLVHDMVVSLNKGDPNIDPQNTTVLNIGTPKMVPLMLGNSPIEALLCIKKIFGILWESRPELMADELLEGLLGCC